MRDWKLRATKVRCQTQTGDVAGHGQSLTGVLVHM